MSTYQILDLSQVEEWDAVLAEFGETDIYYSPRYLQISEENNEGAARLFVFREDGFVVCYPYLMRRINDLPLPAAQRLEQAYYDIVTPYGYGGPITTAAQQEDSERIGANFAAAFAGYCKKQRIVAEFVRFHPILHNHTFYPAVGPTNIRQTVCLDLRKNIWNNLKAPCRNRVRHATNSGLIVERDNPANLELFMELYYATMNRNQATSFYYFSERYFRNTLELLGQDQVSLFSVKLGERTIASAFFIHAGSYVSYHLTGSDHTYLSYAPYNILLAEAAEHFQALGYSYLHLGGGYRGKDELLRFKSTFTKDAPLDFYIGRKVHNNEVYQSLCCGLQQEDDYFPLYRNPLSDTGSIGHNTAKLFYQTPG